jgi:hypothetical protein
MALYSKYEIVAKVVEIGLIPMFYHSDLEIAKKKSLRPLSRQDQNSWSLPTEDTRPLWFSPS